MTGNGRIVEVVLTGGPCAGKTTALARLATELGQRGWRVLTVPEAATMFITGGVSDVAEIVAEPDRNLVFQRAVLSAQRRLRRSYQQLAEGLGGKVCIVYDRAECDNSAYIGEDAVRSLIEDDGYSLDETRDSYSLVIHLTSAAVGAEAYYTTENNTARRESLDEARALDSATLMAWAKHPRLVIVDNSTDFDTKIGRALNAVLRSIGDPMPTEIERKWLLDSPPDLTALQAHGPVTSIAIEQHYLSFGPTEQRVRRQEADGRAWYTLTTKHEIVGTSVSRYETEQLITEAEYLDHATGTVGTIRKTRHCLIYAGHRIELDEFHSPDVGWVCEVELTSEDEPVDLPAELGTVTEVTGDRQWRNAALAATGAT